MSTRDVFDPVTMPSGKGLNHMGGWHIWAGDGPILDDKLKCKDCGGRFHVNHYSISRTETGNALDGHQARCNSCIVRSAARRFFLSDAPEPDWTGASCQGLSPQESHQYFFGDDVELGKKLCADCPLAQKCLEYGKATHSVGLFGGVVLDMGGNEVVLARDTHCKGKERHLRTPENTRIGRNGYRVCRDCELSWEAARRAKKRAERAS